MHNTPPYFFCMFDFKIHAKKKAEIQRQKCKKKDRKCTFDFKIHAKKGQKCIFSFQIHRKKESTFGFFRFISPVHFFAF